MGVLGVVMWRNNTKICKGVLVIECSFRLLKECDIEVGFVREVW